MSLRGTVCSFCGVRTHGYRDCPIMHQYIREQADALAQRRLGKYQQLWEWVEYEPPRQVPTYQGPLYRGGETQKGRSLPDQKPSRQRTQNQASSAKTGIIGSMYQYAVEGMAVGGRGGTPAPGRGGPPDDKPDDESNEEEDDESETDEETGI